MSLVASFRTLWERVRLAITVFRKGVPREDREGEDRETDKAVAEVISGLRKPGLPCPQCGAPIIVSIAQLLSHTGVRCSQCHLELKMSWQDDAEARRALENLQLAAARLEEARRFKG